MTELLGSGFSQCYLGTQSGAVGGTVPRSVRSALALMIHLEVSGQRSAGYKTMKTKNTIWTRYEKRGCFSTTHQMCECFLRSVRSTDGQYGLAGTLRSSDVRRKSANSANHANNTEPRGGSWLNGDVRCQRPAALEELHCLPRFSSALQRWFQTLKWDRRWCC